MVFDSNLFVHFSIYYWNKAGAQQRARQVGTWDNENTHS
jgi:hypothetical protein